MSTSRDWSAPNGGDLHRRDPAAGPPRARTIIRARGEERYLGAVLDGTAAASSSNFEVVETVLGILNDMAPAERDHRELLTSVSDRPGHDSRCAAAADKIGRELGWRPEGGFDSAMHDAVEWYLTHRDWREGATQGRYRLERLGSPA